MLEMEARVGGDPGVTMIRVDVAVAWSGWSAAMLTLFTVQNGIVGEESDIARDVAAGGGVIRPGQHFQDVEPVSGVQGHPGAACWGRSQAPMSASCRTEPNSPIPEV
jgi:hypothetical protein